MTEIGVICEEKITVKFDYNTHNFDHYYRSQRGGAYYTCELNKPANLPGSKMKTEFPMKVQ